MAPKQAIPVSFRGGIDQKSDPFQIQVGKFQELENTIFDKGGLLQKRNGYGSLSALASSRYDYLTTFQSSLIAIGTDLAAYSSANSSWTIQQSLYQGSFQRSQLAVQPVVRSNLNQSQVDSVRATNGLVCTVFTDQDPTSLSDLIYRYTVTDSATGQTIVQPTTIATADPDVGTPRVFLFGNYFVVIYTSVPAAVYVLQYFTILTSNPTTVSAPAVIVSSYSPAPALSFDAAVLGVNLYVAWNGAGGVGIQLAYIDPTFVVSGAVNRDSIHNAVTCLTVAADVGNNCIWVAYYDGAVSFDGYILAVNPNLSVKVNAVQIINNITVDNLTIAIYPVVGPFLGINVFYEVGSNYGYAAIPSHYIQGVNVTSLGVVTGPFEVIRSVGLASKAFVIDSKMYMLTAFQSPYQPTYFLITIDGLGVVVSKLAYSNGGGYLVSGLPGFSIVDSTVYIPYLIKDLIASVNKNTAVPANNQTAGVYSQTGINLAAFTIGGDLVATEIGQNLNMTGGFLWGYDGFTATENNFFVWPDSVVLSGSGTGGSIEAGTYYYQATYEWTDNQGNAYRSAPSIPVSITTTGSTSTVTVNVPTLRLTYKTVNRVKIVIYRWVAAQPIYYQVTSITAPILNFVVNVDSIAYSDTAASGTILGNNILYTNGGVAENIGPPACTATTLFDNRLWLIDAEDMNLLWFSKQVIENTPVEMSDLLTVYVAPTTLSQGSTGPMTALGAMDDKLIIFKGDPSYSNAIYYINGTGPDNTGANNNYSQPTFITAAVGCNNQRSIVLTPQGVMFQSNDGIWILKRDLSTDYIGAPVEDFNSYTVTSAVSVPNTTQVRFTLEGTDTFLMYDYYYGQWGTFTGVTAASSTIYQSLHTYINTTGSPFKEGPGTYLDGTTPVLISFTTGWMNFATLRGYERIHEYSFLGTYYTPHSLAITTSYDYGTVDQHATTYNPGNATASTIEEFRIFAKRQKCKAFQISVQESYDSSFAITAGQGLSLSGLNMVVTLKKGYSPISGAKSVG